MFDQILLNPDISRVFRTNTDYFDIIYLTKKKELRRLIIGFLIDEVRWYE